MIVLFARAVVLNGAIQRWLVLGTELTGRQPVLPLESVYKAADVLCTNGECDFFYAQESASKQEFSAPHAHFSQVLHW
jgi:hypothetical protein